MIGTQHIRGQLSLFNHRKTEWQSDIGKLLGWAGWFLDKGMEWCAVKENGIVIKKGRKGTTEEGKWAIFEFGEDKYLSGELSDGDGVYGDI